MYTIDLEIEDLVDEINDFLGDNCDYEILDDDGDVINDGDYMIRRNYIDGSYCLDKRTGCYGFIFTSIEESVELKNENIEPFYNMLKVAIKERERSKIRDGLNYDKIAEKATTNRRKM